MPLLVRSDSQRLFVDFKKKLRGKRFGSDEKIIAETEAYFQRKTNRSTRKRPVTTPLVFVMDTVTRDIQRPAPYTLLYADDVFPASHSKADHGQLVQKWNNRLIRHGLRMNLNKAEFSTTDPNETSTITVSSSDLPRTERINISDQDYQSTL